MENQVVDAAVMAGITNRRSVHDDVDVPALLILSLNR